MGFLLSLHRTAEFLFLLTGAAYLLAFLFWQNDSYAFYAEVVLRLGDLPLAFFAILYGFTSLRISLSYQYHGAESLEHDESSFPVGDIVLLTLGVLLFGAIAYADLFMPSVLFFPQVVS